MSRDQKPRRSVMVDSAPEAPEIDGPIGFDSDPATMLAPSIAFRLVLPAAVFLFACAIGACAIALVLAGKTPW